MHLLLYAVCFGVCFTMILRKDYANSKHKRQATIPYLGYNDLQYYVMIFYIHSQQKMYTNICNSVTIIMPGK